MSSDYSTSRTIASLAKVPCYKEAIVLEEEIWDIVALWSHFARDTVGKQFVRSMDSVGANIAEGFGREHLKDKIKFYYYARASALESLHWISVAHKRKLVTDEQLQFLKPKIAHLPTLINTQITYTKSKLKF